MNLSFGISDLPPESPSQVNYGIGDRFRRLRSTHASFQGTAQAWATLAKIEKKQAQSAVNRLVASGEMESVKGARPMQYRFKRSV